VARCGACHDLRTPGVAAPRKLSGTRPAFTTANTLKNIPQTSAVPAYCLELVECPARTTHSRVDDMKTG
jgi:hypothetical protein